MPGKHYIARSGEPDRAIPDQSLREHLLLTARIATTLASTTCPGDLAFRRSTRWAGLLHDLGKYRDEVQARLRGNRQSAPHSPYGAAIATIGRRPDISLAVSGHHSGLRTPTEQDLLAIQHGTTARSLAVRAAEDGLRLIRRSLPPPVATQDQDLWTRMVASCLVDADRLDCYRHECGSLPPPTRLNAPDLLTRLLAHINARASSVPDSPVRDARALVLQACLQAAKTPERLRSLSAPTGGGKTLASMAFALQRAIDDPSIRRVIVVIPYLSIIEQNAKVYRDALADSVVLEHHSGNVTSESSTETPDRQQLLNRLATENWDAPIVVTTSVRFFETLFSNRPSDLRRLHNIARSVVILDEVQTLPRRLIGPILDMCQSLARDFGITFVFATATQPAFERHQENPRDQRWPRGTVSPIIPPDMEHRLFATLQRVQNPVWPDKGEKTSDDDLCRAVLQERSALCIVNTRHHARTLFQLITRQSSPGAVETGRLVHLSNLMCPRHRMQTIDRIKTRLKSKQPCLVVSTQLVEAGVDFDFPVVYRAMAPLDSIIQAAGRCDREGLLTQQRGEPAGRLVVFRPETVGHPYGDSYDVTETLVQQFPPTLSEPVHVHRYFNRLYQGDLDPADIVKLREKRAFPATADRFCLIPEQGRTVLIPFDDEARECLAALTRARVPDRDLLRRLRPYGVELWETEFRTARTNGTTYELWPGSDIWACQPSCYDQHTGLCTDPPAPSDYIR